MPDQAPRQQRHSVVTNLLFNIVIPTVIMTKFSDDDELGASLSIAIALAFPLAFGAWDFIKTRRANVFSALGFISILLTGGISLMELDPKYIAIKEAAIPAIIGLATLASMYTPYPLIRTLLLNDDIIDTEKVTDALAQRQCRGEFDIALRRATYMVAGSFFLSSVLNYTLAKVLLVSPPGTPAYSAELGKMTGLSFPVIALPCTLVMMGALFYLFRQITRLTDLELEQIFRHQ